MSTVKKLKYVLPICLLLLTISIPSTSTLNVMTGPNTWFWALKYETPNGADEGSYYYKYESWSFAIRDQDQPTGKASLSDFELFALSYTCWGENEVGDFAETIVFGTLRYEETQWVSDQEFSVQGGGVMTVRPTSIPGDYSDWERVIFKLSATDSYGSKVTISGTYTCASGPPLYYINLMIRLTGEVFEYDYDNGNWFPTGRVETRTFRLKGYVQDYYYISPYFVMGYAYPDQLTWFPSNWPYWD